MPLPYRSDENQVYNAFVPTHQWKVVKENQQIPPGLHVRHNFQTGQTEAKLIDPDDIHRPSNTSLILSNDVPQPPANAGQTDELVKQLPHIGTIEHVSFVGSYSISQNHSSVDKRFRSYDEIKKELASLQMAVKTDAELLTSMMQELRNNPSRDRLRVILEDLSYMLHQVGSTKCISLCLKVDNGKLFAEEKGLNLLKQYLYDEVADIQILTLSAFSATVRGNAKAKIIALQDGVLDDLADVISLLTNASHPQWRVLSTAVSALSAILRHFPSAQRYFFATGDNNNNGMNVRRRGFDLLNDIFLAQSASGKDVQVVYQKLQIQILNLLGDILNDRITARKLATTSGNEDEKKLWKLYRKFPFESELLTSNWCDHLTSSLLLHLESRNNSASERDHDSLEKMLSVVVQLGQSTCKLDLGGESKKVLGKLSQVEQEYAALAKDEQLETGEHDIYFSDMRELVQKVIRLITESRYTDEL